MIRQWKLTTLGATGGGKNKALSDLTGDEDSGLKPADGGPETDGCRSRQSRVNLRRKIRVATWNVQTLFQAGKLANVIGEMRRGGIAIMGVAEARWTGSGCFTSESEELVIYSGADTHERGVAIILSKEVKNSLMEYRAISDRIIYVRMRAAPVNISLYQIYAPTAAAEEETKDGFYLQMEQEIERVQKKDMLVVMGDYNAKVGRNLEGEVGGRFGLGDMNESGERVVNFCLENNLVITNTMFKHHQRKMYTWNSPDGHTKNQIDYIMISKRFRKCVLNSRAYPGADCGSDHNLVGAELKLRFRKHGRTEQRIVYDLDKLQDSSIRESYTVEVNNRFQTLLGCEEEKSPNELWEDIKEETKNTAECWLGKRKKSKDKPWMTLETLKLIEKRRNLKPGKDRTEEGRRTYAEAKSEVQRNIRVDRKEWLKRQCEDMKRGNTKRAFDVIKKLRQNTIPKQRNIADEEGRLLSDMESIKTRWRQYTEELYRDREEDGGERDHAGDAAESGERTTGG